MKKLFKRLPWLLSGIGLVAALVYGFRPAPVPVDLGVVARGPLLVTVEEDGKTRIKQRYIVAAPIAGRMQRIQLKPGDPVTRHRPLALIEPPHALLLDPRAREEAQARVDAAEARLKQAKAQLEEAKASEDFARSDYERLKTLPRSSTSTQELESATMRARTAESKVRSNESAVLVAEHELSQARAALRFTQNGPPSEGSARAFEVTSPISGRVLRVMKESETVVTLGTEILEVGDTTELEAEIDVLTTEAVKVKVGMKVFLEHWGGDSPIPGEVRLIEPSGFTKNSALGVEEQRVNVIVKFRVPLEYADAIGDAYRVDARIVVWKGDDVLRVPAGALFRNGGGKQAVYVLAEGRAVLRPVKIGHNNGLEAEVLGGLSEGDQVILHPSDKIKDGVAIAPRENP